MSHRGVLLLKGREEESEGLLEVLEIKLHVEELLDVEVEVKLQELREILVHVVPLADIAAKVVHPVTQTSIATMLQQCPDTAAVTEWQIPQVDEA